MVLEAKLFIQELWTHKFNWDQKVPNEYLRKWKHLCEDLMSVPKYNIPRCVGMKTIENDPVKYKLLCFCDAFAQVYAVVIYLHQSSAGEYKVDCIFSKTRLTS